MYVYIYIYTHIYIYIYLYLYIGTMEPQYILFGYMDHGPLGLVGFDVIEATGVFSGGGRA